MFMNAYIFSTNYIDVILLNEIVTDCSTYMSS